MPSTGEAAAGAPERAHALAAFALGLAGVTIFAGTLPATRIAVRGLDPAFITAGRAVLAGVIAAALLTATRRRLPRRGEWPMLAAVAACLVFGFPFFTGLAMERVPASHGSVVLAILPLATAVAAALVGGERPGPVFWLLGVAGGGLVLVFSLSDSGWVLLRGDLYLFAAAASAALGYALSGRLARDRPGWVVISWGLVLALPFTALASVLTAPAVWPMAPGVWAAFAYLGVFSMFLGFFFWNAAMALGGIARIGQIQLLQPFLTMVIAALVAGEALEPGLFAFAALIVVVVTLAQRTRVGRR